jgi:hypothetical protein
LVDVALRIGRVNTLPWHRGLTGDAVIAGIDIAICGASATPATGLSVCDTVAGLTSLASAGLTTLPLALTALPLALTLALTLTLTLTLALALTLSVLLALALLRLLTRLTVLPRLLTGLALTGSRIGLSTETGDLIAHTR